METFLKGRGAQLNPPDRFSKYIKMDDGIDPQDVEDGLYKTTYLEVDPKTIVNEVKSPDVGMSYSINPYQGCEHGCVYCYARNTHPYWGYSAGIDFETKIMVKNKAPLLLRQHLSRKSWQGTPIMLSGNTDCYQPLERRLKITRALLEVFRAFDHPVGIITKNMLIQRDLDLLIDLNRDNLVQVMISITTLDESLRRNLEPRTASVKQRLQTVALLAKEGIPTGVMVAPVIPGLNDHEVIEIIRISALMGARKVGQTIVRLNGDVEKIFKDWLARTYPDRSDKICNGIKDCHGGALGDSRFSLRMKGEGAYAKMLGDQFKFAAQKYIGNNEFPSMNTDLFKQSRTHQLQMDL